MRYRNIICKFCGKPATVPTLRKADYCDHCKQLQHNDVAKNSYQNKAETKINTEAIDNLNYDDIADLANEYDKLRLKTIRLYQQKKAEEKHFTKTSDMLTHKLEFENLSDDEILKMAKQVKSDRLIRRKNKISETMLFFMMDAFKMRSAEKFVTEAVKGAKMTKDLGGYLADLQKNEEIYVNARNSQDVKKA